VSESIRLGRPISVGIVVHAPGAGRSFGPGLTAKVDIAQSADFAAFEAPLPPIWEGPPPHLHREYDEAFYVIEGSVVFWVNGATRDCSTGSFVYVPRGEIHGFDNPAREPARLLIITSPGALRLVEEVSELPKDDQGQSYPADLAAIYAQHASEIVGLKPT
jgi:mannose-6-phosphate isomerase-like protein (cupin superfamily)